MRNPPDVVWDTNVWVALVRGELHPARLHRELGPARVLVPPIVIAELGALLGERRVSASVRKKVGSLGIPVGLEDPEAWAGGIRYGKWRRSSKRSGGLADALILEAARSHDAVLVTFDPDFEGERGVHLLERDAG